jgi:hypothetical protein
MRAQPGCDLVFGKPKDFDRFVPGCVAPNQLNLAAPAIQGFRQQPHERLISRRIHRGSCNFDPQFIP